MKACNLLFFLIFSLFLFETNVFAQDLQRIENAQFGVNFEVPPGWKSDSQFLTEKILGSFTDSKTEGKLEVMATRVIREEHANALFEAFRGQLEESGFVIFGELKVEKFGVLEGQFLEYDYNASKIPLRVMVFSFTRESVAYFVIGYFARADSVSGRESFERLVKSFTF